MTDLELINAFKSVTPTTFPIRSRNWEILFDFYNSKHEKKLGMGCRSCFPHVYFFVKKHLSDSQPKPPEQVQITIEDVRKWKEEVKSYVKSRHGISFDLPHGYLGNGWYRIADGFLTNKAGWDAYLEALKEAGYKLMQK